MFDSQFAKLLKIQQPGLTSWCQPGPVYPQLTQTQRTPCSSWHSVEFTHSGWQGAGVLPLPLGHPTPFLCKHGSHSRQSSLTRGHQSASWWLEYVSTQAHFSTDWALALVLGIGKSFATHLVLMTTFLFCPHTHTP